jgi:hypothetical protein
VTRGVTTRDGGADILRRRKRFGLAGGIDRAIRATGPAAGGIARIRGVREWRFGGAFGDARAGTKESRGGTRELRAEGEYSGVA